MNSARRIPVRRCRSARSCNGLERRKPRHIGDRGAEHQRSQHDQKRQREQRHGADQHVADGFKPQQPPAPPFDKAIGAIEFDAQAFDAARSEINRKHRAKREHVAPRGGEHAVDFGGDRGCDLLRPDREDQAHHFRREIDRVDEAGESRDQDQKRKHRHQDRQRDVTRDRPAVVAIEAIEGLVDDAIAQADRIQCVRPRRGLATQSDTSFAPACEVRTGADPPGRARTRQVNGGYRAFSNG